MALNYPVIGLIVLACIIIIFFIIKRNQKDEKSFEKELNSTKVEKDDFKNVD